MSTKTTFKRIALVAVAALGLGVLSVAPSSATVSSTTVTVTNGSAATNAADSTTGAIINVSGLVDEATDTIAVSFVLKSKPSTGTDTGKMQYLDTTTSANTIVSTLLDGTLSAGKRVSSESVTAGTAFAFGLRSNSASYVGGKFAIQLDSNTATTLVSGTYTYTVIVKSYSTSTYTTPVTTTIDVSIVVAALASESTAVSAANSTAVLAGGSTGMNTTVDSAVAAVATASATAAAVIRVKLKNANGDNSATESVTATISGPGQVGNGTVFGKSVVLQHTAGDFDLSVRPDGTAGVATITISTPSVTFAPKSVTFYAAAAKTLTATVNYPVLSVGDNSEAVKVTAVDALGTNWAGAAFIVASAAADALVGGSATTPVACTYSAAKAAHFCPVTTLTTGTAKFKVIDAATVALATATSNEVTVTVSNGTPATVKLAFDKATYAPFEKALITVTPLDTAGKTLNGATFSNLLATGGITSTYAFTAGSDTLTAAALITSKTTSSTSNTTAGSTTYVVYMPASGAVTISATPGVSVAAAGQVAISASAEVVNSSADAATDAANEATDAANAATDAALAAADAADAATAAAEDASAAVATLATAVNTALGNLKKQITALTKLVNKLLKK